MRLSHVLFATPVLLTLACLLGFTLPTRAESERERRVHLFVQYAIGGALTPHTNALAALSMMTDRSLPYLVAVAGAGTNEAVMAELMTQLRATVKNAPPGFFTLDGVQRSAVMAVKALKPDADELIPLVAPYLENPDAARRRLGVDLLDTIDGQKQKIRPLLFRRLVDDDLRLRDTVGHRLVMLDRDSPEIAARLLQAVEENTGKYRGIMANYLIGMRPKPMAALPTLVRFLEGDTAPGCEYLAMAVTVLDPAQPTAVKVLVDALARPENRWLWVSQLGALVPRPDLPAATLQMILHDPGVLEHESAAQALWKLGIPKADVIAALEQVLRTSTVPTTQVKFAQSLLRIEPNQPAAIEAFLGLAGKGHSWAVRILQDYGTNATMAIPGLKKILHGPRPMRDPQLDPRLETAIQVLEAKAREAAAP
jgi:hypothetical protein